MKKLLSMALVAVMLLTMASTCFVSGGASADPADSYTPETAPNEDSSIQMWFQHSTVKVHQDDTASSGKNTYSVYMAKNEMQGAQIILYSPDSDKSLLKASVSDFTAMDGSGASIPSQLYYEFYVNTTGLYTTDIYGLTNPEDSFIREGMTPDAIAPIENINAGKTTLGTFNLGAGKTQALYYKLTTASDTPSGWYSGKFELKNSSGETVKTATMYAYVWDFEIPEETTYQSSYYISATNTDIYKTYYDYLLENRLLGMNVPGELNESNEYINNPRVTAFRIANPGTYLGTMTNTEITAVYDKLSASENWETYKKKAYFYTVDEPTSEEQNDSCIAAGVWTSRRPTVENINNEMKRISSVWPDPYVVVPYHESTPYPYKTYSTELASNGDGTYATSDDGREAFVNMKDSTQGLFDANSVTIWCPKMCAYTPRDIIKNSGYNGNNTMAAHVRNLDGIISGFNINDIRANYFDWDSKFGVFEDRFNAYQAERAAAGQDIKLWWYSCGNNANYTYAGHLIENTGLQTEIMSWQAMQVGVTGYLYYGVDLWKEISADNFTAGSEKSYSGSAVDNIWPVNKTVKAGYNIYGNGVLMYGKDMGSKLRVRSLDYIGTIRVEQLRDGVEDYEMLEMYRDAFGEEAMQNLISKVSDNVACYLSLPLFDRSSFDSTMTNDDIFAAVRIELGNAVEKGAGTCTEHVWDEGVVTKEATFDEEGEKLYTCTVCGETKTEVIKKFVKGDVNGDGKINLSDVLTLRKALAGDDSALKRFVPENADVNADKKLTSRDVLALRRLLSGDE